MLFLGPVAAASLLVSVASVFYAPSAGFYLLPSRVWELLTGALVALRARPAPKAAWQREAMGIVGMALVLAGVFLLREDDPFPGWNALIPCIGTALIIQANAGSTTTTWIGNILSTRPFMWFGNISYSFYLIHWPLVALYRYRFLEPPSTAIAVVLVLASVGLATACRKFVEQPFLHANSRCLRTVLFSGAGAIAAAAVVGLALITAHGLPFRFKGYTHQIVYGNEEWGGSHCFQNESNKPLAWDAKICTRIHGRQGRLLLWGDSYAAHYIPGILRDSRRINADVLQYTFAGCPPILAYKSLARLGCEPTNLAVPGLITSQRIDTVVMSARWAVTPLRTLRELHKTIIALRQLGVKVYVFGQSPQFIADVQQIDYISGDHARLSDPSWHISFDPALNTIIEQEASIGGAIFVDPLAQLCHGTMCPYRHGGEFLFEDSGHFSRSGSLMAVKRYFPAR